MRRSIFYIFIASILVLIISFGLSMLLSSPDKNCAGFFGLDSKTIGILGFVFLFLALPYMYEPLEHRFYHVLVGLVLGGGVYNSVFRVVNGCVVDNLSIGSLRFNFSDVSVTIGVFGLICYNFYTYVREKNNFNN